MHLVIAFVIWLFLLTPALNLGKAWDTAAMLGPQVMVHFADAPKTGFYVYKLDGSEWLVDKKGEKNRLGNEVISSVKQVDMTREINILAHWRGPLPSVALTLAFFVMAFWMPRKSE